jgi:hypothetical protein
MSEMYKTVYMADLAGGLLPCLLSVVPGIGFQPPEGAIDLGYELAAPAEGFAWTLLAGEPVQVRDYRGTVYSTATGAAQALEVLGDLPEGVTVLKWPGPFHVWLNGAWQLDQAAQQAAQAAETVAGVLMERDSRLSIAALRIAPLQDAQDLGEATSAEEAALLSWKRYRVALNRVEQQGGYPHVIEWPSPPSTPDTP